MAKDVIIACDFPSGEETLAFLDRFRGRTRPYVKIGMELFYAQGPDIVRQLKDRGHSVFLDLKLHDIPNTVGRAMGVLSHLGADMINLHAAGGSAMMEAAIEGLSRGGGRRPLLIAVTQLTSTSQERLERELLIDRPMEEVVTSYARTAKAAGLDGVVCSPLEAGTIHASCGEDFLTVTPGVRFAGAAGDDQQRITTPAGAKALGSDYIVVGRPITQAPDPVAAYEKCLKEFLTDNNNE
ncbi:MAG: orotidine-5'-phosphate decarboxylase [Oscillospiraceae bacterium]|nr:orotidine-5'-phosphate decarboxylase [Oscillospiraceae bacterium]